MLVLLEEFESCEILQNTVGSEVRGRSALFELEAVHFISFGQRLPGRKRL